MYGLTPLSPSAPAYTGPYTHLPSSVGPSSSGQKEQTFPERPGQPECQYYLRTGDCKFGSSCRYHHPSEWDTPKTTCVLSPMGLPLRPVRISLYNITLLHFHAFFKDEDGPSLKLTLTLTIEILKLMNKLGDV